LTDPLVAIVAGSKSDEELVQEAASVLERFGVPYQKRVISAHRTPQAAFEFSANAAGRGIKVIIAIAGKAAHLAGVLASGTILPVIGVPAPTSDLGGLDSLLSTVQMPSGVPVATVAIGKAGAHNAALLAVSILSLGDDGLAKMLRDHKSRIADQVASADEEFSSG